MPGQWCPDAPEPPVELEPPAPVEPVLADELTLELVVVEPVVDVEPLVAAWATAAPPMAPAAAITAMTLDIRGRIGDCLLAGWAGMSAVNGRALKRRSRGAERAPRVAPADSQAPHSWPKSAAATICALDGPAAPQRPRPPARRPLRRRARRAGAGGPARPAERRARGDPPCSGARRADRDQRAPQPLGPRPQRVGQHLLRGRGAGDGVLLARLPLRVGGPERHPDRRQA